MGIPKLAKTVFMFKQSQGQGAILICHIFAIYAIKNIYLDLFNIKTLSRQNKDSHKNETVVRTPILDRRSQYKDETDIFIGEAESLYWIDSMWFVDNIQILSNTMYCR